MIVVVGERQGGALAASRRRVARLMGTTLQEMLREVVWLNLFEVDGAVPEHLVRLVERASRPGDAIVLLGVEVRRAWGLDADDLPFLSHLDRDAGPRIVSVPHPSGLSRWWNDPENREAAAAVLREVWGTYRGGAE